MSLPQVLLRISVDGLSAKGASRSHIQVLLIANEEQREQVINYNRRVQGTDRNSKMIYHTHVETLLGEEHISLRVQSITTTDYNLSNLEPEELAQTINRFAKAIDFGTRYFPLQWGPAADKINASINLFSDLARSKSNIKHVEEVEVIMDLVPVDDRPGFFTAKFVSAASNSNEVTPLILAKQLSGTEIFKQTVAHPVSHVVTDLASVIMDLNDDHNWSFEQIADWLETLDININIARRKDLT